jgi:hypothetical protein
MLPAKDSRKTATNSEKPRLIDQRSSISSANNRCARPASAQGGTRLHVAAIALGIHTMRKIHIIRVRNIFATQLLLRPGNTLSNLTHLRTFTGGTPY